jgi:tRNA pseudouridine32 synthase/23S rRNA pseudouridine746 synthase
MSDIPSRFEKHIEIRNCNTVAVDLLAAETGLSKQQIKQVMQKGAVWISKGKKTQRLRRAKKAVHIGETIHFYYDKMVLDSVPPEPTLMADEGRYSVWNKPYGMLSQGSKWGDHCTITRWAEQHLRPQRVSFIVHRLDRAANGLILIAHEKNAAAALSKLFQDRQIDKRYQILVHGQFSEQATRENPVKVDSDIDGRSAVSYFTLLKYEAEQDRSLLGVSIDTGRKHQIRRHAALLGFPVVGDRLHGTDGDKEDLQLCAYYLAFKCPYSASQKTFDLLSQVSV